jgi:hypothetical protein
MRGDSPNAAVPDAPGRVRPNGEPARAVTSALRRTLVAVPASAPRRGGTTGYPARSTGRFGGWLFVVLQGGARLRPRTDATTVRVRDDEVLTSDGPFAETKEVIGGYYLVDCKDLDEAIEVAAKIPGARHGSI